MVVNTKTKGFSVLSDIAEIIEKNLKHTEKLTEWDGIAISKMDSLERKYCNTKFRTFFYKWLLPQSVSPYWKEQNRLIQMVSNNISEIEDVMRRNNRYVSLFMAIMQKYGLEKEWKNRGA